MPNYWGVKRISNRISTIDLLLSRTMDRYVVLTIINVYAPTSEVTKNSPAIEREFYDQLQKIYDECRHKNWVVMIAGDMNAKIGQRVQGETFMGNYSKGTRNRNGHQLASFLATNDLYATNTTFQHRFKNMTTWRGHVKRKDADIKQSTICNQIDYIIIQRSLLLHPGILQQSQSIDHKLKTSDHKTVITTFRLRALYYQQMKYDGTEYTKPPKYDYDNMRLNEDIKAKYSSSYEEAMKPLRIEAKSPEELYQSISKAIKIAAEQSLIEIKLRINGKHVTREDVEIRNLCKQIVVLQEKLMTDTTTKQVINKQINYLRRRIKKKVSKYKNDRIRILLEELEANSGNAKCFNASRRLSSLKRQQFILLDQEEKYSSNPNKVIPILTDFYQNFFSGDDQPELDPWIGSPRPLVKPITEEEVEKGIKLLGNNRAHGPDTIVAEQLKGLNEYVSSDIAVLFNTIFENHQHLNAIGEGNLIVLNKPGKIPKVNNTRPITLVNMLRKILSTIILRRIQQKIESYISITQSGFRKDRSTSDLVWTYRWMMAYVKKYDQQFHIMGIDLSKAFDCLDRNILISEIENVIDNDELRIVRYLLSNTTLQIRYGKRLGNKFKTTIGTPQGDALSPILFIFYLEIVMKYHRNVQITEQILIKPYQGFHMVTHYADDTDIITTNLETQKIHEGTLEQDFRSKKMILNSDKTEYITMSASTCNTLKNKKLGTILSDYEDVKRRISLADQAFKQMSRIWVEKTRVNNATKIRLYNACVKPVLTYNLSCLGTTTKVLRKLDVAHRKHLKKMLNIYYPLKITNLKLYDMCDAKPISIDITEYRMRLFGHVLRSQDDTPAQIMMKMYFNPTMKQFKKNIPTSIVTALRKDLKLVNIKLSNLKQFEKVKELAQDRSTWSEMVDYIVFCKSELESERMTEVEQKSRSSRYSRKPKLTLDTSPVIFTTKSGQSIRISLATPPNTLKISVPRLFIKIPCRKSVMHQLHGTPMRSPNRLKTSRKHVSNNIRLSPMKTKIRSSFKKFNRWTRCMKHSSLGTAARRSPLRHCPLKSSLIRSPLKNVRPLRSPRRSPLRSRHRIFQHYRPLSPPHDEHLERLIFDPGG